MKYLGKVSEETQSAAEKKAIIYGEDSANLWTQGELVVRKYHQKRTAMQISMKLAGLKIDET